MALKLEQIRALADRVAASHGLDIVDIEYQGGGGKHRTLRVFIEKNEAERAKLRARVARLQAEQASEDGLAMHAEAEDREPEAPGKEDAGGQRTSGAEENEQDLGWAEQDQASFSIDQDDSDEAFLAGLPGVASLEFLSGVTHGDCEVFSQDFGTVLEVEELGPGTEYLLEISSPGLDRRLSQAKDYRRFTGSLVKVQTFEPVAGNRHWQGRLAEVAGEAIVMELGGKPQRKKAKGARPEVLRSVEIALSNVEKAQLVPEF